MTYRRALQNFRRLCAFTILFGASQRLCAATFLVTTNADSGLGSLRNAITVANATPGPDVIGFNIPGSGAQTITINSDLPAISDRLTIDGTTQPGYAGKPLIVLSGSGPYYGLRLNAGSCVVRGLTVNGFIFVGIYVLGSSNIIESCFVGTDPTGTFSRPNGMGIQLSYSFYNNIGGSGVGNLISGNSEFGLFLLHSSGNVVQGNFVGTDATGANALGNRQGGIVLENAPINEIGGTGSGEGNLISGNDGWGIELADDNSGSVDRSSGNVIEGNIIGLDLTGRAALGNSYDGIDIAGPSDNTIGGTDPKSRNIISGNGGSGIAVTGVGNVVQGNWVGIDVFGSNAVANHSGVYVAGPEVTIGGTEPFAGNVISGNLYEGIQLDGTGNVVQGNFIGSDASGRFAVPNGTGPGLSSAFFGSGVYVRGFAQTIGGGTPEARNLISGNRYNGISLDQVNHCVIQGNWIGLSISGEPLGNNQSGIVLFDSATNTIGGAKLGEGNICSGNTDYGIVLTGYGYQSRPGSRANALTGNYVGVGPDGRTTRANARGGIGIGAASGNFIGGSESGDPNVISGNGGAGILTSVSFATNPAIRIATNVVQGNLIGLDAFGQAAVPNAGPGIDVAAPVTSLQIGGTDPGEANRIAYNRGNGLLVRDANAVGVTISANSIYSNDGLGINLQPTGEPANTVTSNDDLDADNGPNHLQNSPVITNTVYAGGLTVISGYLRSVPNEDFDIEVFADPSSDPSGYGEGQNYLDTTSVSTDASGFDEFQLVIAGNFGAQVFTATATRSSTGDTSEFSSAVPTLQGVLRITNIRRSGTDIQISFTTDFGTNYRVEWTAQLPNASPWNTVSGASNVAGTGNVVSIKDTGIIGSTSSQRFYRIRQL